MDNFEAGEIATALSADIHDGEFDLKSYFATLLSLVQSYKTHVVKHSDGNRSPEPPKNPRQYKFSDLTKVKVWRCAHKMFAFKNDVDTLAVTVAMCLSVCQNRWDNGGTRRREKNRERKEREKEKQDTPQDQNAEINEEEGTIIIIMYNNYVQ